MRGEEEVIMEVENRTKKEGGAAEQKGRLNKEGMKVGETLLLDFQLEIWQSFFFFLLFTGGIIRANTGPEPLLPGS